MNRGLPNFLRDHDFRKCPKPSYCNNSHEDLQARKKSFQKSRSWRLFPLVFSIFCVQTASIFLISLYTCLVSSGTSQFDEIMMYFLLFLCLSSSDAFRIRTTAAGRFTRATHPLLPLVDFQSSSRINLRTRLYAKKPIGYKLPDLSQSSFPEIPPDGYFDLVVIGSGPAGESAAVRAAQLGARVAIVEKKSTFGGPTGLTSKAVREAASRICKAVDQLGTVSGMTSFSPSPFHIMR